MRVRDAERYANQLLTMHGLKNNGWRLRWATSRTRAGRAVVTLSGKHLELSKPIVQVNERDAVLGLLAHEMAHSLAYEAGDGLSHGAKWKHWVSYMVVMMPPHLMSCEQLDTVLAVAQQVRPFVCTPNGKHQYQCPSCSSITQRQRKPRPGYELGCVPCRRERGVWVRLREMEVS